MVSKTEVIINYMLKYSKEKNHGIYSKKLNFWYFLNADKNIILRKGEDKITRAGYFEIKLIYEEFIEAGVEE